MNLNLKLPSNETKLINPKYKLEIQRGSDYPSEESVDFVFANIESNLNEVIEKEVGYYDRLLSVSIDFDMESREWDNEEEKFI